MQVNEASFRALIASVVPTLSNYSVGFTLPVSRTDCVDAVSGGSGTLVAIDNVLGILTASHVINELRRYEDVGLILVSPVQTELHNVSFKTQLAHDYSFTCGQEPSHGPDLGLIIPPPNVLDTLKARMSFYNLSKRKVPMLERPQSVENGFWVLSGIVGERTSDAPPERGFSKVKVFRGIHGAGKVVNGYDRDSFDYLVFEALYNEFYEGPESYGGVSGGGLWQVLVRPDGSALEIAECLLSGVAFHQSAQNETPAGEVIREITCHGRRSLYQCLIEKVRAVQPH